MQNVNPSEDNQKSIDRSVLLLHGLGVYGESWWFQKQMLENNHYFPIAPDLPGFGSTPPFADRWSIQRAVKSVLIKLDDLGVEKTVVCGLSMGGTVALQLVLDFPERVSGLILINTFAALRPTSLSELVYFVRRGIRAYILSPGDQAELVAKRIFPQPEFSDWRDRLVKSIRNSDPEMYRQAMLALAKFNVTHRLHTIVAPVLVITGECDSTIPPMVQARLAKAIPQAQHEIIKQAGHGVIVDHHDEVNQLILQFIERIYSS